MWHMKHKNVWLKSNSEVVPKHAEVFLKCLMSAKWISYFYKYSEISYLKFLKPVAHWIFFIKLKSTWCTNICLIRQKSKFNYMVTWSHECLKQSAVKSQSVCDCSMQNLKVKFVLKDIQGMQQSKQRISMEKKTTKSKVKMTWVNLQHIKKTDKKQTKER